MRTGIAGHFSPGLAALPHFQAIYRLTIVPDTLTRRAQPHPAPTVTLRPRGMECQTATEASDGDTSTLRVEQNPPARLRLGVNKATEGQ